MNLKVVKLQFNSPVHFGRGLPDDMGKSLLRYHSDSLKSALFSVALKLNPALEDSAKDFFDAFQVSSCFPWYNDSLFFPKPMLFRQIEFENVQEHLAAKKAKKIEFVSQSIFEDLLNDRKVLIHPDQISTDGKFVFDKNVKNEPIVKSDVQQKVKVPLPWDQEKDSKPYYLERLYFNSDGGLYFLLDIKDDSIGTSLLEAIHFLGEEGIGTDRYAGNGFFRMLEPSSITINAPEYSDFVCNLSLYLPTEDDLNNINLTNSYWSLIKRGGYIGGASDHNFYRLRKKSIYMFEECGVFNTANVPNGDIVDLKPSKIDGMHEVLRDGRSIFLPIKVSVNES